MATSYNIFEGAFLSKITEYDFIHLDPYDRNGSIDSYMHRACAKFNKICKYDLMSYDDIVRELTVDIPDDDLVEIVDIVSTGMVVQWLQPYVYKSENLENILNTADYSVYSPAELLLRVREVYQMAQKEFKNMIKDYSYDHGDLTSLAL